MQQQKTRLRRDSHTDLISEFEATTTFKALLGEEHLDVAEKLSLVARGQPAKKQSATLDRRHPVSWKRLSPQPAPTSLLQQTEHYPEI
jgi:hypothetical protein